MTKQTEPMAEVHGVCPECGSEDVSWNCGVDNHSGVQDGRLRVHDVHAIFYLGCNVCSETIRTVRGDDVAAAMTKNLKRGLLE